LVARSILEMVGALRYALNQMRPITHQISTGKYTQEHVRELLTHERAYLMDTRFDWLEFFQTGFRRLNENYVKERSDEKQNKKAKPSPERGPHGQINAYTFIEKWAISEPGVGVLYALLSDLVHPSIGGVMSTVVETGNVATRNEVRFGVRHKHSFGFTLFENSFPAFQVLTGRELSKLIDEVLRLFLPTVGVQQTSG
jgi:hypothetical protein